MSESGWHCCNGCGKCWYSGKPSECICPKPDTISLPAALVRNAIYRLDQFADLNKEEKRPNVSKRIRRIAASLRHYLNPDKGTK